MALGLLEKPMLGEPQVSLRDYQEEAIEAVRAEFRKGIKRTLVVSATGTGKTVIMAGIGRKTIEKGGRVLFLVNRTSLIRQVVGSLDLWGVDAGVEWGQQSARAMFEPDAVVAMVQSLHRRRLATWERDYFNLIICDEAHHGVAGTFEAVFRHFGRARLCGFTATVDRGDGEDLGQVFESIAYEYNLWDAMTAPAPGPWLCRLKFVQCPVQIDLRDLSPRGDDYSDEDLAARLEPLLEVLANSIKQEIGGRQTIVFLPRVKTSDLMAAALQGLGLRAVSTDGIDPDRVRKEEGYKKGEFQVLCNVLTNAEGFDAAETAAVALCRPTKSRSLYAQMVGRGTRLKRSHDNCLVIDFDFLTAKHDLVKLAELCDSPKIDSEVTDIAQEMMRQDKELDLVEAIERAEKVHKERVKAHIRVREREIQYRKRVYDPLDAYEALGLPWRGGKDKTATPATPRQIELLNGFKIADAEYLSKTRASTLLDYAMARRKKKPHEPASASPAQLHHLIGNGVDPGRARNMSRNEASATLSEIFETRRRRAE